MDKIQHGVVAVSEYCSLNYCKKESSDLNLNDSVSQCNHNRTGLLCGECQLDLSLVLGSEWCLPYSNNHLAFLTIFLLAGPVLVGFISF